MKSRFHEIDSAIASADWDEVKRLILAGAGGYANPHDEDDPPLIYPIIEAGQEDLAIFWLDHGFPHFLTTGGRERATILHWAARYGMPKLIKRMRETDIDINEQTLEFHTPLWYAASSGQLACLKLLLADGAHVNGNDCAATADTPGDTPLCVAANAEIAECMLDAGANPALGPYADGYEGNDSARDFGMDREILTPLTCAALDGRMGVVRLLVDRGIPLDAQALRFLALDSFGRRDTHLGNARELIALGANPDGEAGKEPLLVAARAGNAAFCSMLLDAGARPQKEALAMAVLSGNEKCVNLFLDAGDMAAAIRMAAKIGVENILEKLLALRPDLVGDALLGAIVGCRLNLARAMLDRGASPNFRNRAGETPLMVLYKIDRRKDAFRFMSVDWNRYPGQWEYRRRWRPTEHDFEEGDFSDFNFHRPNNWNEILKLIEEDVMVFAAELIGNGADIHATDNMGRSCLWHACAKSWLASVPWLASLEIDVNNRDNEGNSAFDAGCLAGESFTIEPMLEAGAVIDARDANGDTALIKSAREFLKNPRSFSISVIVRLLHFGADPDLENNSGQSLRKWSGIDKDIKFALELHERLQ